MSWEMLFITALLALGITSFVLEKIPSDMTALGLLGILLFTTTITHSPHLPSIEAYMEVFSSPAPITIAAMFIISTALEKCGLIENISVSLGKLSNLKHWQFLFILLTIVAILSAFINNTAIVVVLLPVVLTLARTMKKPASKFLIPISYASIFGGCCTAIGTSTNILLSGILVDHNMQPLSMFELAAIGVPLFAAGTIYLALGSSKLLPSRETLTSILSQEERKEFITEAYIQEASPLVGTPFSESEIFKKKGIRLIEIIRQGISIDTNLNNYILQAGDRLILACRSTAIMEAHSIKGIHFADHLDEMMQPISAHEGSIVEAVIGPTSGLIGQSIKDCNFRQQFRMLVLAVHRKGQNVREKLNTIEFKFGDTLLLMGTDSAIEHLRSSEHIILLDKSIIPAQNMRKKTPIVLSILAAVVISVTLGLVSIVAAAIMGVCLVFLTGCLKPKEGYHAIEWRILVLIYGMLSLGKAMEASGLAQYIAQHLVGWGELHLSDEYRPYIMLGVIYFCTATLTELLTNNATVVLMTPIAIGLALTLGVDPRPFAIATCIGSSASFSTPIGYQTNTYVYGVGGYKFKDFFKVGFPLNIMFFIACVFLIPYIWKF